MQCHFAGRRDHQRRARAVDEQAIGLRHAQSLFDANHARRKGDLRLLLRDRVVDEPLDRGRRGPIHRRGRQAGDKQEKNGQTDVAGYVHQEGFSHCGVIATTGHKCRG